MGPPQIINFLITIVPCLLIVSADSPPRVTIKNGTLEGSIMQSRQGRDFFAFRGIPYARPPVGELRFQPPEPPTSWEGVRSAAADGPDCLQQNYVDPAAGRLEGSEDCLFMNVYTLGTQSVRRYPVMVWFYGGFWKAGSSSSNTYNPKYLMDHDIVFVAMNYRLGPFGFLSTADNVIPGNQALKDHVQALRWVKENIGAFGGDPNRVTIAGESYGAASVNHLMLSPLARGLFHQAISESGTAIISNTFNTPNMARESAARLGRGLNCPVETSQELLTCLRSKDAEDIALQPLNWTRIDGFTTFPFVAVVEANMPGAFLTEEPGVLLRSGRFADVPWLNGLNADEGAVFTVGLYISPNQTTLGTFNDNFLEVAPSALGYSVGCSKRCQEDAARRIRRYYFGSRAMDESTRQDVVNMFSDDLFAFGSALTVLSHFRHKTSPVYFYEFAYRGTLSYTTVFGDPVRDYGVSHADELLYLFPASEVLFNGRQMSKRDFQMVDAMSTMWTNFVKTGKPVPSTTRQLPVEWKPVTSYALENFIIGGPENFTMSRDMYRERLDFWSSLPCRAGLCRSNKVMFEDCSLVW